MAVVHVLQALLYVFIARIRGFFTWGAFCALRFVMFHFTVLRRSLTSVTSGKFLLLCLVPVIGWGIWFFSKTKRQYSEEEDLQRHGNVVTYPLNVQVQQVCDRI